MPISSTILAQLRIFGYMNFTVFTQCICSISKGGNRTASVKSKCWTIIFHYRTTATFFCLVLLQQECYTRKSPVAFSYTQWGHSWATFFLLMSQLALWKQSGSCWPCLRTQTVKHPTYMCIWDTSVPDALLAWALIPGQRVAQASSSFYICT